MKVRLLKTFTGTTRCVVLCVFVAGIFGWHSQCRAQQSAQPSALSNDPLKLNWISGPQKVNIGNFANVTIPEGYRLTDAQGARIILDTFNTPVPDDVIGVLASDSSKSLVVVEYSSKGYVKDADVAKINAKSVLKAVQNQIQTQDGKAVNSLAWNSAPAYDAQAHSLAWSLQVQTAASKTLNESEVLLGRHGYIELTAVESYPLAAASGLDQIAANITFNEGERYSDYQNGDKVAQIGLAEVITGEQQADTAGMFNGGFAGAAAAWIYAGLVLLMLGGLIVLRRKSQRRPVRAHARVQAVVPVEASVAVSAAVPTAAAVNGSPVVASAPVLQTGVVNGKNGELNGHAQPKAVPAERNGSKHHRHRRKRVFDYSKFYTNVVKELSLHSYGTASVLPNGKYNGNGHSNGRHNGHVNGNGHANGHTNGYANGHANGNTNGNGANGHSTGANDTVKVEIEQLIATQKRLIEEQKCLLEQQTRLIEEKRWLIQEQSAFLKGQANLIEDQQAPLKFE